jgi:hypothetical protein
MRIMFKILGMGRMSETSRIPCKIMDEMQRAVLIRS